MVQGELRQQHAGGSITNRTSQGQPGGVGSNAGNLRHPRCGCMEGLYGESQKLTQYFR